jgi:hypothetical protein
MSPEMLVTVIVALLGGGGFVALINAYFGRHKNKAEVTDLHVKTAIELERVAMERYSTVSRNLDEAEKYLAEARKELAAYRSYVKELEDLLIKHDIDIPERVKKHER